MKTLALILNLAVLFVPAAPLWGVISPCAPHLFQETGETEKTLDNAFAQRLAWLEHIIETSHLTPGSPKTWESVQNGIVRRLTMTLNADGSYSFELDLAASSPTLTFFKVWSGSILNSSGVTNATLSVDYDALKQVVPTSALSGQATAVLQIVIDPSKPAPGIQNTSTVSFTNFLLQVGDSAGPRTGGYLTIKEPGIGGFFNYQDALVLLCPANPNSEIAERQVVQRWYLASDGSTHERSDAQATGGQIPSGDQWIGLACTAQSATGIVSYNLLKLEDASGNTVTGGVGGAGTCDPLFGAVPSLTNNATDWNFTQAVTFPNEW